jgi:hypothetical protein
MIRALKIKKFRIQPKTRLMIWIGVSVLGCAGYGLQQMTAYCQELSYATICRYRLYPAYYKVHHCWPTSIDQAEREFEANLNSIPVAFDVFNIPLLR